MRGLQTVITNVLIGLIVYGFLKSYDDEDY